MPVPDHECVIAATRAWVEHAVLGLNLCPFARKPFIEERIRYVVSSAPDEVDLLIDLRRELQLLAGTPAERIETTLLIHPQALTDFDAFNDFLDSADAAVAELGLTGALQIATFHPEYRFAGTVAADVTNATNRAPYPMLHLLREESVEWAAATVPSTDAIYEANIRTLRELGTDGWRRLQERIACAAQPRQRH